MVSSGERPEAGRTLDERVAREVMGLHLSRRGERYFDDEGEEWPIPEYSTEIAAAWEVVEKLRSGGWLVRVQDMPDGFPYYGPSDMHPVPKVFRRAHCALSWMPQDDADNIRKRINCQPFALADTVPHAICLAALDSVAPREEKDHG